MICQITELLFYSSRQRTWKWTGSFPIYFDDENTVDCDQSLSVWIYNAFDQHRERTAFMLWESGKSLGCGGSECRCDVSGVWRSQHLRGWAFNTRTPLSIERGRNCLVRDEVPPLNQEAVKVRIFQNNTEISQWLCRHASTLHYSTQHFEAISLCS
jgi:hypothetical protein